MSLFSEIQRDALDDKASLASLLRKVRLLASILGSDVLEDWVGHESSGYPSGVDVPEYRVLTVTYRGWFSGPFGSGLRNAPLPSSAIAQVAGEHWLTSENRQSIAEVEQIVRSVLKKDGSIVVDCSNLPLIIQGSIYPDYVCNEIQGHIQTSAMVGILDAVRNRVLEFTIKVKTLMPEIKNVRIEDNDEVSRQTVGQVNKIASQVIYGNVTNVVSTGQNASIDIQVGRSDKLAAVELLTRAGIAKGDAEEFLDILSVERPESEIEPFGSRAKLWIAQNLSKATDGVWQIGIAAASEIMKQVALRYYGLK